MADEAITATTTEAAQAATTDTNAPLKAPMPKSALERATAALAKAPAKEGAKVEAEEPAEGEQKDPKEGAKPKEPEVKEPRLSRAMAIIAEREQRVIAREKAIKESASAHEAKLSADSADLGMVRDARAALAKGGKLAALRVLIPGLDHRALMALGEELSREVEPSAEDIARRVASEEWENRQKSAAEKAAAEEASKSEREQAADQVRASEFCGRAAEICGSMETTQWPHVVAHAVNGPQFWQATKQLESSLGRRVSPEEVLGAIEKELESRDTAAREIAARRAGATTAAKPVEPAKAKSEPAKQASRAPTTGRKPSPLSRAEAAMKRLNIS